MARRRTLGNLDTIPAQIATVLLWLVMWAYHITVGKDTYFDYRQLVLVLKKSNVK